MIKTTLISLFFVFFTFSLTAQEADEFLSDFLAVQIDEGVFLRWTIKAGNTCDGTRIERSINGSGFNKIGEIPGVCGSPDISVTYEFTDNEPEPNRPNLYRLELGILGYSSPVMVEVIFLNDEGYSIQPNPIVDQSRFVFDNPGGEEHEFCLIDTFGRQIMNVNTSSNVIILDRTFIPAGTYVFKLLKDKQVINIGKLVAI